MQYWDCFKFISFKSRFSGVMLRGSGYNWDLRKINPFTSLYKNIPFTVPIGTVGDCYDRFLIRVEEIKQSIKILEYCNNILINEDIDENSPISIMTFDSNTFFQRNF